MYKKILVPLDGSTTSTAALTEALRFASAQSARLTLLFVCESLRYILMEGPVDLTASIKREGETILSEAAAKARAAGVDAEVALVEAGERRVAEVIVEEAKRSGADLIAMGTHGRRGVQHLMLGSVAEGVIRRAGTPVLLLRSA
jgi:nucleotide-binding universal stress UspA family protein